MFSDEHYMQRALYLASLGGVDVAPNPMVGAVIVLDGKIIGEGYHKLYGTAHAEVNAVESVADKSVLKDATIYVTLEPCAHFGKTPPCANLLIQHKFKKVVVATQDPFPQVAGKGIELLKEAGIEVVLDVLKDEAVEINKRFFTFHQKARPYVFLKWAETADGFIAPEKQEDRLPKIHWISGKSSQVITHKMRSEEQAILVGRRTIENDNPSLTTRAFTGKNPIRIVVDPELKIPTNSTVLTDGNKTIVLNEVKSEVDGAITYFQTKLDSANSILKALHALNITSVIVEGGTATIQRFIDENLWDEALVIQGSTRFTAGIPAPKLNKLPSLVKTIDADKHLIFQNNR